MAHSNADKNVVKELKKMLLKGHSHAPLEKVLANIPANFRGIKPDRVPYSIWQLVEHIRLSQWDMLDFSRNPDYVYQNWPADYWPQETAPANDTAWDNSLKQIAKDREAFVDLLEDSENDLSKPFHWGEGQNLIGEAIMIADHTGYHLGEIVLLRRILGIWE